MNVTEKQKEILICFMKNHPDFGRGRLRYNSENKRKIDELWEKLSIILNTAACGPHKSAKEWAKTWRDWKCNTLKKVAKHKTYMMGTGGGSPKHLHLSAVETSLIEFLTPDASGFVGIPEGAIEDIMLSSNNEKTAALSYNSEVDKTQNFLNETENVLNEVSKMDSYRTRSFDLHEEHAQFETNKKDSIGSILLQSCMKQKRQLSQSIQSNTGREKYFDSSLRNIEDICTIENKENISEQDEVASFSGNIQEHITAKYSEGIKKPRLMATAINLLEKKSSTSETIKIKMLELKEKKLEIMKEQLTVNKKILQQIQNINGLLSSLREELVGQYLEKEF